MVLLGLIIGLLLLLAGFLFLTSYEARRGARFFGPARDRFDAWTLRMGFIATNVDFESFLRESLRTISVRLAHQIAHLFLLLVRTTERLLTRLVKHLRTRPELSATPALAPRPFVKAMSDFKEQLASARPTTMPELQ